MVERMSSVEIEDVLSSIRRLVTDDLRPKPVAVDNKLILTPALRVVTVVPAEPEITDADVLEVDLDADLTAALTSDLPEDAHAAAEDAWAGEVASPMFLHRDRRIDLAIAPVDPDFGPADLGETVSQISAGIPADGYEAELGDVMPVPEWPESSWVAPDAIDVVEEAELIPVPELGGDEPHVDWLAEPQAQAKAPVDALANDDAAEAAALAALAAQDAAGLPEMDQDAAVLTELDEDMLREIVRDIIREELHGSLGERITRNVRKLVRAEINRALITQDME